jgi:outer membrane lipoprotein-sorting protein
MNFHTAKKILNRNPTSILKGMNLEQLIGSGNYLDVAEVKIDTEIFAEKVCQLVSMKDDNNMQLKMWLWNTIPLQIVLRKNGQNWLNLKVSKIDENATIPDERFKIPPNVSVVKE